jgi:hypothetical protein
MNQLSLALILISTTVLLTANPILAKKSKDKGLGGGCNPENDRYYCLGYKHGEAAANRGDANDCPNDDPGNPNNSQYCYGFSQGYKHEANAK